MNTGHYMSKMNKMMVMAGIVMGLTSASTRAADEISDGDLRPICELSGGTSFDIGGTSRCCWPNWGCLTCSDDGVCAMDCDTADCCEANGGCFIVSFPDDVLLEQPDDEPPGRPGRPGLDLAILDDAPVVASAEGLDSPGGVSESRFGDLILDMGPDTLAPASEQGGVIDDPDLEEADEDAGLEDPAGQSGDDAGVSSVELCGAGSSASMMFGLMGLAGVQRSGRRRRTAKAPGRTAGRMD